MKVMTVQHRVTFSQTGERQDCWDIFTPHGTVACKTLDACRAIASSYNCAVSSDVQNGYSVLSSADNDGHFDRQAFADEMNPEYR